MDLSLWLAIGATATGTYAMRFIPLLWMQRHLRKHNDKDAMEVIPQWLSMLGPLMIAAMFGLTLIPKAADIDAWIATLIGCAITLLSWHFSRSLGLPVLLGVVAFGLSSWLL